MGLEVNLAALDGRRERVKLTSQLSRGVGSLVLRFSGETPTSLDDENRPRWGVLDRGRTVPCARALQHFSL